MFIERVGPQLCHKQRIIELTGYLTMEHVAQTEIRFIVCRDSVTQEAKIEKSLTVFRKKGAGSSFSHLHAYPRVYHVVLTAEVATDHPTGEIIDQSIATDELRIGTAAVETEFDGVTSYFSYFIFIEPKVLGMKGGENRVSDECLAVNGWSHVAVEARQCTMSPRNVRYAVDGLDIKIVVIAESQFGVTLREELPFCAPCNEICGRHRHENGVTLLYTYGCTGIGIYLLRGIDSVSRSGISMNPPDQ